MARGVTPMLSTTVTANTVKSRGIHSLMMKRKCLRRDTNTEQESGNDSKIVGYVRIQTGPGRVRGDKRAYALDDGKYGDEE